MVIMNPSPFYASNVVDVLTVNYVPVSLFSGQPQSEHDLCWQRR